MHSSLLASTYFEANINTSGNSVAVFADNVKDVLFAIVGIDANGGHNPRASIEHNQYGT